MAVTLSRASGTMRLLVEEPHRPGDPEDYIAALHDIGSASGPFALLIVIATHLDLSHEHKKSQNLWFKATRERLNALCRACAIVRIAPTEEMQRTFQGLWVFPVKVTGSVAEAETFLAAIGHGAPQ